MHVKKISTLSLLCFLTYGLFSQVAILTYTNSSTKKRCFRSEPDFTDGSSCPIGDTCYSFLHVYKEGESGVFATYKRDEFTGNEEYYYDGVVLNEDGKYSFELEIWLKDSSNMSKDDKYQNLVEVYSPEATNPIDANPDEDLSFKQIFKVNPEAFSPFDPSVWTYYWDFGDNIENYPIQTDIDTIVHMYHEERLESVGGYEVKLTIAHIDSADAVFQGCRQTYVSEVSVFDHFFKSETDRIGPMSGDSKEIVNCIILNSSYEENRVYDFNTNGYDEFEVYIYNRWGKLVEKVVGTEPVWDGKKNLSNTYVAPGVYYYVIRSNTEGEFSHESHGFIHVFNAEQ